MSCSGKDCGIALKNLLSKVKDYNDMNKFNTHQPLSKTCNNCKYHVAKEGYDWTTGMTYCVHSWCKKGIQDSKDKYNPNYDIKKDHILYPCEEFEYGEIEYIRIPEEERKKLMI